MKNYTLMAVILTAFFSCNDESEKISAENCHLSAVTASNAPTSGFIVENSRLTGTTYDGVRSDAVYTYDANGRLTKIETGTSAWLYTYDSNNRMIRYDLYYSDAHEATGEYTYGSNGSLQRYVRTGNLNADVQSLLETEYEFLNGNSVKETSYIYSSGQEKGTPLVTTIKYDSKKNPYNTLGNSTTLLQANNPIEYRYSGRPEQDTDITYAYNDEGYPVTYKQTAINRADYPDVTGTYEYQCK